MTAPAVRSPFPAMALPSRAPMPAPAIVPTACWERRCSQLCWANAKEGMRAAAAMPATNRFLFILEILERVQTHSLKCI